jgi:hypothetical protein
MTDVIVWNAQKNWKRKKDYIVKVTEYLARTQDKILIELRPGKYNRYLTMFGNVLFVEDNKIHMLEKQPWSNSGGYNGYGLTPLVCQIEQDLFINRINNKGVILTLIEEMDKYIKQEKSNALSLIIYFPEKEKYVINDIKMEVKYL